MEKSAIAAVARSGAPPGAAARIAYPSAPALYLVAIALLAGDAAGSLHEGLPLWPAVVLGCAAAAAFLVARMRLGMILALSAIAIAGAVSAQLVYGPPLDTVSIRRLPNDRAVAVEGTIDREPEHIRDVQRLYLRVQRAAMERGASVPASGLIRITVLNPGHYRIGERLRVSGEVRFPRNYGDPGGFDYEAFMARQGIAATMLASHPGQIRRLGYRPVFLWTAVEGIRNRIGLFIDAGLSGQQRAEMRALIIGDRGAIDRRLRDLFALTGMAHLLIISGLHLGFVASMAFILVRLACIPFPRLMNLGYANKLAAVGSGLAVTAYAAIAGTHVSTLRALIMVLCYMGAVLVNRSREVLASLATAALIICFTMPGSSLDIGFELSFAAVLGIVLGMRRYAAWWERVREGAGSVRRAPIYRVGAWLVGYLAVSFFALIATAPLTAYYFNQFSLVGLIANPVVVPVIAMGGMVMGLFAAAMSFVCRTPALWMLHLGGWALALGNRLAEACLRMPGAWMRTFTPTPMELALIYGLIALWLCAPIRRPIGSAAANHNHENRYRRWSRAVAAMLVIGIAVDAAWWVRERYFDPRLRVTFLSVGQGDAAVVQFPGSAVMLIDGGARYKDYYDFGERVVAPFLWSQKIMHVDYLALSHPELDHFGGFTFIARNFHPTEFWTTGATSPDLSYAVLLAQLSLAGTRTELVNAASMLRRIGGVMVRCLGPQPGAIASRNNNSMVLDLARGPFDFLFTGDLEEPGERLLMRHDPRLHATVLKVPHHGSITSSSAPFVEAVSPAFAIISDGYHNRYHFPAAAVIARYRREGAIVLRTDEAGAVGFEAGRDRMRLWTGRYRKPLASYRAPLSHSPPQPASARKQSPAGRETGIAG